MVILVLPIPNWPSEFRPQQTTLPAGRRAQVRYAPAATVLKAERKYATTRFDAASVTVQVAVVPLHEGPPHPANNEVASAVAVNVIVRPIPPTVAAQSALQLISPISVLTV